MVVPSNPGQNAQCDAGSLSPNGLILGWGTEVQSLPDNAFQVAETSFSLSPLSNVEAAVLVSECSFIEQAGSGKGICSCGTGD